MTLCTITLILLVAIVLLAVGIWHTTSRYLDRLEKEEAKYFYGIE